MRRHVASAAFIVGLFLVLLYFSVPHENREVRLRRLTNEAYAQRRSLELRIHGAPYTPLPNSAKNTPSPFSRVPALIEAEATMASLSPTKEWSPEVLSQEGRVDLLMGAYDSAISTLQEALNRKPNSAELLDDLASAYFERAEHDRRFADYGQAFELQSKALDLEPDDEVILFNRAITAGHLYLFQQSSNDWDHYLQLDTTSKWAIEARERLVRDRSVVAAHEAMAGQPLLTIREFANRIDARDPRTWQIVEPRIEDYLEVATLEWLPVAFPMRGSRADSIAARRALTALAVVLEEENGDTWLGDAIVQPQTREVREAWEVLSRAIGAADKQNFKQAIMGLGRAEKLFSASGDEAGALRARLEEVEALLFSDRAPECLRQAISARQDLASFRYQAISIQMQMEEANCLSEQSELGSVEALQEDARKRAKAAHYPALSLRALSYVAGVTQLEGKQRQTWQLAMDGLSHFWSSPLPPMRGYNFYFRLGLMSEEDQLWHLQMGLDQQCLELLGPTGYPLFQAVVYSRMAHAALMTNAPEFAQRSDQAAQKALASVKGSQAKSSYEVGIQIDLASAEGADGDVESALHRLKQLDQRLPPIFNESVLVDYYETFGKLNSLAGHSFEASRGFERAIGVLERERSSMHSEADRLSWMREADPVYRNWVRSELPGADGLATLAKWEFLHSASLRKPWPAMRVLSVRSAEHDSIEVQRLVEAEKAHILTYAPTLAGNNTMLIYALFDRGLAIWSVDRRGISVKWVDTDAALVRMMSRRFAEQCATPVSSQQELTRLGQDLYKLLIAPVADRLQVNGILVVEADDALGEIPFQALVDPRGRYLSELHSTVYLPGIEYLPAAGRRAAAFTQDMQALVVAATHGDRDSHLLPLPDAIGEARDVARHFRNTELLIESEASLHAVTRGLSRSAVFHFSGHSRLTPERMQLLLGRGQDAAIAETLDVSTIDAEAVQNLQLAVLSACSTERGPDGGILDPASLSRYFLRAGVPHVVATKWNVDSEASAILMRIFYDGLASGKPVASALAHAETEVRRLKPHPYYWAAFDSFGEN
jgi:CHAT domain-containing protein/tetratricopeptide (TPR) repeat protein